MKMRAAGVVNVTNAFDVFTTRIIRFLRKFLKIDFFAYRKMGDSDGDYVVFDRKKKEDTNSMKKISRFLLSSSPSHLFSVKSPNRASFWVRHQNGIQRNKKSSPSR